MIDHKSAQLKLEQVKNRLGPMRRIMTLILGQKKSFCNLEFISKHRMIGHVSKLKVDRTGLAEYVSFENSILRSNILKEGMSLEITEHHTRNDVKHDGKTIYKKD